MTSAAGAVLERTSYDAFGASAPPPSVAPRGYTGHVSLARSKLVHMKGRVYDPRVGQFLSPDPVAPAVGDAQSLNRYAYVASNPLRFVDPTGFLLAQAPSRWPSPGWPGVVARRGRVGGLLPVRVVETSASARPKLERRLWLTTFGSWISDGARSASGAVCRRAVGMGGTTRSTPEFCPTHARSASSESLAGITQPDDVATLYYVESGPTEIPRAQKFEGGSRAGTCS
jgi:RHS repeat-associated protein